MESDEERAGPLRDLEAPSMDLPEEKPVEVEISPDEAGEEQVTEGTLWERTVRTLSKYWSRMSALSLALCLFALFLASVLCIIFTPVIMLFLVLLFILLLPVSLIECELLIIELLFIFLFLLAPFVAILCLIIAPIALIGAILCSLWASFAWCCGCGRMVGEVEVV